MKRQNKLAITLPASLLLSLISVACCNIYVPTGQNFGMPLYGTYINFLSNQNFTSTYRVTDSNSTYGEFWFFNGYGLQCQNTNVTVTAFFVGDFLNFTCSWASHSAGTVQVYTGAYGSPSIVTGASYSYSASTGVATLVIPDSSAAAVTVRVTAMPTPSPTPMSTSSLTPMPTPSRTLVPTPVPAQTTFAVADVDFGVTRPNQTYGATIHFTFSSSNFTVYDIQFAGSFSHWLRPITSMPMSFSRGDASEGTGAIQVLLSVPSDAMPENLTGKATVYGTDPYGTTRSTSASLMLSIVTEQTQPKQVASADKLSNLLIIAGVVIVGLVIFAAIPIRTRSFPFRQRDC